MLVNVPFLDLVVAERKLTLKRTGSVSPEHFHKMNLALKEEGTTAAGMSI